MWWGTPIGGFAHRERALVWPAPPAEDWSADTRAESRAGPRHSGECASRRRSSSPILGVVGLTDALLDHPPAPSRRLLASGPPRFERRPRAEERGGS